MAAPRPLCRVATVAAVGIERRKRSDAAFDANMVDLFCTVLGRSGGNDGQQKENIGSWIWRRRGEKRVAQPTHLKNLRGWSKHQAKIFHDDGITTPLA